LFVVLEIRLSALKHGVSGESIAHAVTYLLFIDEDFQETEPSKVLILGPDAAGNILEVIGRFRSGHVLVVFHAMPARPALLGLLTQ
jgi:hypothetical protein